MKPTLNSIDKNIKSPKMGVTKFHSCIIFLICLEWANHQSPMGHLSDACQL